MCGIVGYIGEEQAEAILLRGLKRLEYRGYDSAGIALMTPNGIRVEKQAGRLSELRERLEEQKDATFAGKLGIAHTRWATHGAPSKENAHPHRVDGVTLVHNGIIENAHEEKEKLVAQGAVFSSETDTEVIVHRIARAYRGDAVQAIREGLDGLRGSFALAILFGDQEDCLYAVRRDSPLYIGFGMGESALASDMAAFPAGILRYLIPEEEEIVCLMRDRVAVYDRTGNDITAQKTLRELPGRYEDAEMGDYPHFMRKEIAEQPGVIEGLVRRYLGDEQEAKRIFADLLPDLSGVRTIHLVGCGSAMHASLLGEGFLRRLARVPAMVHVASEFRYADPILDPSDLVIVISQSGETADSLAALRLAVSRGIPTLAIVNAPDSTMTREAGAVIYTHAGPEIAVATTKAFTAQVVVLALLALRLAAERGTLSEAEQAEFSAELSRLGSVCREVERSFAQLETRAETMKEMEHCFFLGRGMDYALSMEGALKLKEISYIHCEAYPAGELKHGTISLISKGTPCVISATGEELFEKTISGAKEVRARGAAVMMLTKEGAVIPEDLADFVLRLPSMTDLLMPIPTVIALQYFAYCVALCRGCDVDKPRNLAKSVTVE